MVKIRPLNLYMVQEVKLFFYFSTAGRGEHLKTKKKLNLRQIFSSTEQNTKKYKTLEC